MYLIHLILYFRFFVLISPEQHIHSEYEPVIYTNYMLLESFDCVIEQERAASNLHGGSNLNAI